MGDLSGVLAKLDHLNLSGRIDDIQPTNGGASAGASCDESTARLEAGNPTKVTIKKLRISSVQEDIAVKKIERDLRTWSDLRHRNILPLLGYFWEAGELHLATECMERGTLHEYIPNLKQKFGDSQYGTSEFSWTIRSRHIRGTAAGLAYLHENGIVHGDLTSYNILISQTDEPRITISSMSHFLTSSEKESVRWTAVELLMSSDLAGFEVIANEKSDVWAFGMTLYEILKGEVPYSQLENDMLVALAIVQGRLPNFPTDAGGLSMVGSALWNICSFCWQRDRERRPSMRDLLSNIDNLREGRNYKFNQLTHTGVPECSLPPMSGSHIKGGLRVFAASAVLASVSQDNLGGNSGTHSALENASLSTDVKGKGKAICPIHSNDDQADGSQGYPPPPSWNWPNLSTQAGPSGTAGTSSTRNQEVSKSSTSGTLLGLHHVPESSGFLYDLNEKQPMAPDAMKNYIMQQVENKRKKPAAPATSQLATSGTGNVGLRTNSGVNFDMDFTSNLGIGGIGGKEDFTAMFRDDFERDFGAWFTTSDSGDDMLDPMR
ncbi:kinase-like protein [Schizopora paradoxa]|uniref:Kinase-like protein n=1 Tax=Schizopora paradoxa TaxID=27342 RepID=A0A0H2RPW9_9AGAM|nr:kinase-like protein [Schizopora paradoxa]